MKVLFACGGTAGHINPAIAIADTLKADNPDTEILFVGNPHRMEAKLVPQTGYRFTPLLVEGFHRSFRPASIAHNFMSIIYFLTASIKVRQILKDFAPDVVVGTGGYVSGPVLREAAKMKIKTVTHESNALPGITTKMLAKYVDKVLLSVEDAEKYLPSNREYIVTGNPVRPSILKSDRDSARRSLGVFDRICVLSYGGSNGAYKINEVMAQVIPELQKTAKTHHIHAAGRFDIEVFPKLLKEYGVDFEDPHLDVREYINNMDECLAAADLVVCRAGAMALSELQALGRASILIPSPNVAENHQYHNAAALASRNAAILIEEKNLSSALLLDTIRDLLSDHQELQNIAENAKSLGITDASKRICDEIYSLTAK